MPGLAGIIDTDRPGPLSETVHAMAQSLRHRPWYVTEPVSADGAAFETVSLAMENRIAVRDGVVMAWSGMVYGTTAEGTLAEWLLERYLEGGCDAIAGLNGIYSMVIYDGRDKTCHIINDRFGFCQMYYWQAGTRLHIASEYKAFLTLPDFPRTLNEQALADYLELTYVLDCDTLFSAVQLFPPASVCTFKDGKLTERTYWEPAMNRFDPASRREEDVLEEYHHHLQNAVTRRMGEHNLVLLTGGLDSRTLGGLIARNQPANPVTSVSMGFPKSYDVRFGTQLAQALGFEHHFVNVPHSYVADHAETGGWRLEGSLSAHGYWSFEIDPLLENERPQTVTHGLLGDSLAGERSLAIKPQIAGKTESASFDFLFDRFFATTFTETDLADLLKPELYGAVKGSTKKRLWNTFRRAPSDDFFNRVAYMDLRQRQRQFTRQQIEIYRALAYTRAPFADYDFVDFMYTLPHVHREGKALYKKMIMKYLPETTSVPYTSTGIPMNASPLQSLAIRAKNRMKYRVLPAATLGRFKPEHFGVWIKYDEWLRTGSRDYVSQLLGQEELFEDHFNVDTIRRWVRGHMDEGKNYYGQLCILVTYGVWRKQFCS